MTICSFYVQAQQAVQQASQAAADAALEASLAAEHEAVQMADAAAGTIASVDKPICRTDLKEKMKTIKEASLPAAEAYQKQEQLAKQAAKAALAAYFAAGENNNKLSLRR